MSDTQPTPYEAFLKAFEELLNEYLDDALEAAGISDAQVNQLITAGWDSGRARALEELRAFDPGAHDLASCRCWACEAFQIMAARLRPLSFGRS